MFKSLSQKISVAAVAGVAATAAAMVPTGASAQSYGYGSYAPPYAQSRGYDGYPSGYYDPCARERQGRTGAGATIGALGGAVAGSQLAARGRRTEGSILGGVLGAVVGGAVGRSSSDNCRSYDSDYRYSGYDNRDYAYDRGYDDRYYDDRYRDDYYDRNSGYYNSYPSSSYGSNYGYVSSGYSSSCRSVQTTRQTYNGRTVTEYREVC